MNKKIIGALIAVVVVVAGAIGAAVVLYTPTPTGKQVNIVLPVVPSSYWSMFYSAANQGYYAEEGLNVSMVYVSEGGFGVIKQIAAGKGEFGYAGGDTLMVARSKDIPVVAVYQAGHSSPWSIIAKKGAGINELTDIEGKTMAIQGPENPLHLAAKALLKKVGVDYNNVTYVPVGGTGIVPALVGDKADAVTGNELYRLILEQQGVDFNIWYPRDYGVDFVCHVILVSEDTLKNDPELVEKFVRATAKGLEYAITHPEETVDGYIKNFNPSGNKEMEIELWQDYISEVVQPDKYSLGQFNRSQWQTTQDIIYDLGAMDKKVDLDKAYTAEFMEKVGK